MIKNERDINNYIKMPEWWELTEQYGIPKLDGIKFKNPPKTMELTAFNEAYKVPIAERKKTNIHFFLGDYLFERTWSKLTQTAEFLEQYKLVLSPDFSLYTDMPKALQLFNHYKKMYVSKFWQDMGIKVVPVACWSDRRSFDFCFDGMPKNSLIAVSSVGVCRNKEAKENFTVGYEKMSETLEPTQILWYGRELPCIDKSIQHIFVQPDYDNRFKKDINRA